MSTSSTTIYENTSSDGESFQDFPGHFFQVRLVFPLRFMVSETSHTSVYFLRVSCKPHSYLSISLASFRAWMDPTSKKEGHCDLIACTALLYVLFCLIYMYCPLYVLHCTLLAYLSKNYTEGANFYLFIC
jgi:hypothetical protein